MFTRLWKKNKLVDFEHHREIAPTRFDWFEDHLITHQGLKHPQWEKVYARSEQLPKSDQSVFWCEIARNWMHHLVASLKEDYKRIETDNFILVSTRHSSFNRGLLIFLERCRKRLLANAKGITQDEGYGKWVVIAFHSIDAYYDYTSHFGSSEGVFGQSSGMFIDHGYGHFVFFDSEIANVEAIAAHEMTHALMRHLDLPTWLDEGMAVNMESLITGYPVDKLSASIAQHQAQYWGPPEIQEFWRGSSFSRPDEGQRWSYQLAQLLVDNLSTDYPRFVDFINQASWQDAGEQACQQIYGFSLSDMVEEFLGEGDWTPNPNLDQI